MELTKAELERARRGDRAARARLVEVYQDRVYAVCRAYVREDASDCAQDALLKILTSLDRFESRSSAPFGAYAVTIARNTCLDRLRAGRVRAAGVEHTGPDVAPPADVPLVTGERAERVRIAVLALPDDQRAAIVLRLWGELDYEHIAELEGVPIGTIRSRLSRARDALRTALRDEEMADAS